jgi:CHAT domain-containing protein
MTLSPQEIQSLVDSETLLLSYYTLGDTLHAVVVSTENESIHTHILPTSFSQLEQRYRFLQRKLLQGQTPHQRLADLWQRLIAPLSAHLQGKTRLLIIPCRGLFNLPFAACYDHGRQRYLIEDISVQLLPSATVLGYCRRQPTGARSPLLAGYPGRPDQTDYLSHLKAEFVALQNYLPEADLLLDERATYDNLLDEMRGRSLVHIAGHAHYETQDPLASGVYLAEGRQLRASDLYVRRGYLQGATVVLSACSSGKGRPTGWDVLGLHSAFLYGGAVSIVGGLWQVDDESTMRFMSTFYQYLLNGEETAEALRHAQLTLLADGAPPYHWAPFTLYGDSRVLFPDHIA